MRTTLSQQIQSSLMYTSLASRALMEAQEHAVSGKRITKPSDDVPGTNRALSLRSAINTTEQFANNITVSQPMIEATEGALESIIDAVQEIRNIAVQAANTDLTDTTSDVLNKQLDDLLGQMADLANTKHTDQYVFSGTATNVPAIEESTSGTAPYTYAGNNGSKNTQVLSWVSLPVNIPGSKVFNFDGSAGDGTTDLFSMVTQLQDAITSGDKDTVSAQLDNIDKNLDNLLSCTARIGSWLSRMESASNVLSETEDRMKSMLSDTEDIDLVEAVVDLKTQENVYQTALSITSRMMDLSLASLEF
jgi:flagellar hook-associated protein 3 FlgL